jgi:hypothetical protein
VNQIQWLIRWLVYLPRICLLRMGDKLYKIVWNINVRNKQKIAAYKEVMQVAQLNKQIRKE